MTPATATEQRSERTTGPSAIRPFRIIVQDAELSELRRRISTTRWPDRETVPDQTQGVQLATMQALARYWTTDYNWRTCEAKLNALPQYHRDRRSRHSFHSRAFQARQRAAA